MALDNTEVDVPIFEKALKKFNSCDHAVHFFGQKSCSLFSHQMDNSLDVLHHCGCCRTNTSEPTTSKKVRFQ
jgi:hypothetical protein